MCVLPTDCSGEKYGDVSKNMCVEAKSCSGG